MYPLVVTAVVTLLIVVFIIRGSSTSTALWAGLCFLVLSGTIRAETAFKGFSNEAFLTIAFLMIFCRGLDRSGIVERFISKSLLKFKSEAAAIAVSMLLISSISAFMSNTLLVAALIKPLKTFAARRGLTSSKFLIPLAYAASTGGLITIIGTSTNLLVLGVVKSILPDFRFGFWEPALIGVPFSIFSAVAFYFLHPYILPVRKNSSETLSQNREYSVEFIIKEKSELHKKTIEESGLRHLEGGYLAEIFRDDLNIVGPSPDFILKSGDQLIFVGAPETLANLKGYRGLIPALTNKFDINPNKDKKYFEAVISNRSFIIGSTAKEVNFRDKFSSVILAILRQGERIKGKIGEIAFHPGDTLLLESTKDLQKIPNFSRDFFFVLKVNQVESATGYRWKRATLIGFITLLLMGIGIMSTIKAAMIGAVLMILSGCTSYKDFMEHLDMDTLLTIGASLGLGFAWDEAGIAKFIANTPLNAISSPLLLFIIIYVVGVIATEFLSNNAVGIMATAAFLPLVISKGLPPTPFIMAIMVSASASFLTTFGYQTNLMVAGPGAYKDSDFLRAGVVVHAVGFMVSVVYAVCVL